MKTRTIVGMVATVAAVALVALALGLLLPAGSEGAGRSYLIGDHIEALTSLVSDGITTLTGPVAADGGLAVAGPTAALTATPALVINNLGAANDALVVKDSATPVFKVGNAGAVTLSGALAANAGISVDSTAFTVADASGDTSVGGTLGVTGVTTLTGAAAANGGMAVAGPTAAATATPALLINNLGAANDVLVVADSATPVFKVGNAGVVTGKVLQYGTSGQKVVCSSTTITGTGTLPTGLATPSVVTLGLGQDATGDCNRLSFTNAAATVTAKCWNSALTPAAAATAAVVNWCVVGSP